MTVPCVLRPIQHRHRLWSVNSIDSCFNRSVHWSVMLSRIIDSCLNRFIDELKSTVRCVTSSTIVLLLVLVIVNITLFLSDLSSRMQRSVGRLFDRLTEAGRQIRDMQQVDLDTRQALEGSEQSADELRARCDDLEELLKQETGAREYLSLEFYKADGKWTGQWVLVL